MTSITIAPADLAGPVARVHGSPKMMPVFTAREYGP